MSVVEAFRVSFRRGDFVQLPIPYFKFVSSNAVVEVDEKTGSGSATEGGEASVVVVDERIHGNNVTSSI